MVIVIVKLRLLQSKGSPNLQVTGPAQGVWTALGWVKGHVMWSTLMNPTFKDNSMSKDQEDKG